MIKIITKNFTFRKYTSMSNQSIKRKFQLIREELPEATKIDNQSKAIASSYMYWIEVYMKKRGMTLKDLSIATGLNELKYFMQGEIAPSFNELAKIEKVLNISFQLAEPIDLEENGE